MPKRSFKAIIVGGSVAGLTLAHTLSKAGVDYVLLETRDAISPQLGAGILLMPNGARILDQMGLLDKMKEFTTGLKRSIVRRDDGREVSRNEWPKIVGERLGYQCNLCERRVFLQSMYDQLEDHSRILLGKEVVRIEYGDKGVTVMCNDGTEFECNVVIGADGIHSRTRKEMQRLAEKKSPGLMDRDKNSITAEYNCFFGISSPIPSLIPGDSHVTTSIDHSTLLFASSNGSPQWFFFSKMPQRYVGESNIPRFTKSDMLSQVQEFSEYKVSDTVTVGELMEKTSSVGFFPLEEASHEVWTYGRVVCVGDAIHKMTPNMGQGGNQAIESAAVLT